MISGQWFCRKRYLKNWSKIDTKLPMIPLEMEVASGF